MERFILKVFVKDAGDVAGVRRHESKGVTSQRKVNPSRIRTKLQVLAEKLYGKEEVLKSSTDRIELNLN